MKLKQITLSDFRCFRDVSIDLSSDVVVIYGRNGTGKTSVFDAVEVALLGSIGRFREESDHPNYVANVYSKAVPHIRVDFDGGDNLWVEVACDSDSGEA